MVRLFFDIETIPAHEDHKDFVLEIVKKKSKARAKNGISKSDDDLHRETSLEGTFGRICCIGFIKEDGSITRGVICGDEKDVLEQFWQIAKDVDLFIGHNVFEFDLPFIYKRSIILGVKPRMNISFAKYRNDTVFDTMCEWEKWAWGKAQKLDTLAKVLGLPTSKDEMDGSMVWDFYQQGKIDEICNYCMKDVELTRQVYYRMIFEEAPKEALK